MSGGAPRLLLAASLLGPCGAAGRVGWGRQRLKPPVGIVCGRLGHRAALLAHQISQSAPKTGIFNTTKRKKIGQNPSHPRLSVPAADGTQSDLCLYFEARLGLDFVGPGFQGCYVGLLDA